MRKPKFKAFIKEYEMVVPVECLHLATEEVEVRLYKEGDTSLFNYEEVELMEFTGLKDKNCKEIYEGDIIRAIKPDEYIPNRDDSGGIIDYVDRKPEEKIFIVEYFGASFAIKDVPTPLDWIVEEENIEVIGNIYENLELLEGC